MQILRDVLASMSEDIAIDLGTANTLVYVPGRGIVLDEPSVVAVRARQGLREVIAVGAKAKSMLGRTPEGIETIRPLREGVIADFVAAEEMMRQFISRTKSSLSLRRPRVLVCVPASSTPVERRAVYEAALSCGARKALLIEEPVAAALGAGLPVNEAQGSMIVDIGGGTTDTAVLSLGGVLLAQSVKCAGYAMDEAIMRYIRRHHHLQLGEANAERIKIEVGSAVTHMNGKTVDVHIRGRDTRSGAPNEIVLGPSDIAVALDDPIERIAELVQSTIEQLPPELSSDICDRGVCLTGGGSLLDKLDEELGRRTGIKFFRAEFPLKSVIIGCGMVLDQMRLYEELLIRPD